MLPTLEEKLLNIQQDMTRLGRKSLELNQEILEILEQGSIADLKKLKPSSKQEGLDQIAAIDTQIIHVFALYTPEARDLRQLVAFLKITNELDRIINSCRSFIRDFPYVLSKGIDKDSILEYAIPLQKASLNAVTSAIALFEAEDKEAVDAFYKAVVTEEGKSDEFYKIIEKSLFKKINKDIHLSNEYQSAMFALRRLEKIADRALSIAYLMHYAKIGGEINKVHL